MSELDPFFKFKIGDTVRPVVQRPGFDGKGVQFTPQILQVVERYLVECYGGIQATYRCRAHTALEGGFMSMHNSGTYSFVVDLLQLSEPELTDYAMPELTAEKPAPPPRRPRLGEDNAPV